VTQPAPPEPREAPPALAVVLAAGQGTRMNSELAKVLHPMCGRSLLGHVLAAIEPLAAHRTLVVVGHGRDQVVEHLRAVDRAAEPVTQSEQRGTGHAVQVALDAAADGDGGQGGSGGVVLVVPGDAPLLRADTLRRLLDRHAETKAAVTLLTAVVPSPGGYGRILRDVDGHVSAIVEERDADEPTRQITEVGTSVYAFDIGRLRDALGQVTADNAQGELYLTDAVGILVRAGAVVASLTAEDYRETLGVNDGVQLAQARRLMRDRIVEHWLRHGVTVLDPSTTWIGVDVRLEPDSVIHQNVQLHGATYVGRHAQVGPDSTLRRTVVGDGASVVRSHCTDAEIGPEASVGPFSYLRPGARLGRGAKVGAYVEVKSSRIGDGSKVPHLSYVGDATIGERTNIGAATVFVNYDGVDKHVTVVGDDVRVGSDSMLVAPVTIGDGAYTAAGSVINEDVPPGAMAVARARQRNVEGWVQRRRPGTKSAEAARRASERATMGREPAPGAATDSAAAADEGSGATVTPDGEQGADE
jgi:bifunctional UDP-N-acetylglucosamine pyrophosphorylase/glucosamine-1-phosphate N-acetyltransferase